MYDLLRQRCAGSKLNYVDYIKDDPTAKANVSEYDLEDWTAVQHPPHDSTKFVGLLRERERERLGSGSRETRHAGSQILITTYISVVQAASIASGNQPHYSAPPHKVRNATRRPCTARPMPARMRP